MLPSASVTSKYPFVTPKSSTRRVCNVTISYSVIVSVKGLPDGYETYSYNVQVTFADGTSTSSVSLLYDSTRDAAEPTATFKATVAGTATVTISKLKVMRFDSMATMDVPQTLTQKVIIKDTTPKPPAENTQKPVENTAKPETNTTKPVENTTKPVENTSKPPVETPKNEVKNNSSFLEHEATVSKISEEQLFYLMSRGINEKDATQMILMGFIEPFSRELPMEYAVELNQLIKLDMEGSVG